jgi:type III secretion protein U
MSKDEIKREFKEGEGDPQLKGERKQLAREMIENPPPPGQGAPVKVVVANPTHCAVALAWRPGMVPVVVARGEDRQAVALREAAEAEGVAVFTNRSLARRLVQLPRGSAISADTFEAVGAILRCIAGIEALAPASAPEPAA